MKKLLLLIKILVATVFIFSPGSVLAEVTTPYIVDEKDQVLFGDSIDLGTHYGLENYEYDYVEGYLHIKFSLSHHQCCTAAYPPSFYITSLDPRATTTLSIRRNSYIYPLHTQPTHLTGVYFYDIQLDLSGYRVVVTASSTEVINFHQEVPGLTNTDYVALVNHFTLFEPISPYSMAFTPLPIHEEAMATPAIATTTPVIIVPGIASSYLNKVEGMEVWLNLPLITTSLTDVHLDQLSLNTEGISSNSLKATSIIRNIGSHNFFNNLLNELEFNEYDENSLYEFPYDWRVNIKVLVEKLKSKIDEIKAATGVGEVDLVAHSMGGLLVKSYLAEHGGASVRKFIDIGTPHLGAPKVFKILSFGDNFGFEKFGLNLLSPSKIKEITQNMPAVYQLLPSANYFDESDPNYRYYVLNGVNGNDRLSYEETSVYMKAEGRNGLLIDRAQEFHEEIDGLNPTDYGVETYNFVGCGTPTIGQFFVLDEKDGHYTYNIKMINGDGTVPLKSAEAMQANQTIYVRNAQHAVMPSTTGVKELIASLLTATSTEDIDISLFSNLSLTSNGCTVPNGKIVSFHSPIELHVYDQLGNHVGPNSDGDIENNIEGVVYEVIDDNKFAYLPDGVEYTVRGSATDAGSFDVRIQELVDGEVASTTIYANIPLTLTSQTSFIVGVSLPSIIPVDHEGDNEFESIYPVSTTTSGLLEGTGKIALVVEEAVIEKSSSSHAQFTRNVEAEMVATSTENILELPPLLPSPPALQLDSEKVVEAVPELILEEEIKGAKSVNDTAENELQNIETESEEKYENAAVVYKSIGYKVRNLFINIWGWFKDLFG